MSGVASEGTAEATLQHAAGLVERLLSGEEEGQPVPETPAPKAPQSEPEEEAEPAPEEQTDESDESEEGSEEQPEQPSTYRVKVDGKDEEVTLDELLKGYSRTQDYTRKTQAHAEKVKSFEGESAAVRSEREQYATGLRHIEEALKQTTPQEPDWAAVQQENPAEFPQLYASWQLHKDRMKALGDERQRAEQKVLEDRQAAHGVRLQDEQQKLLDAIPEWKDPVKAKAEAAKLAEYAQSIGFSQEDLQSVEDHRALLLLRKAQLYDAAQQKLTAVKPKVEAAKVVPPTGNKRPPVSEITRGKQRLAKTGRVEDAASLIEKLLG